MSALNKMMAELERFYEANGVPADRILVPPDLMHEALKEADSLTYLKCAPGMKNYFCGALVVPGEKLQARADPIKDFVVVPR